MHYCILYGIYYFTHVYMHYIVEDMKEEKEREFMKVNRFHMRKNGKNLL